MSAGAVTGGHEALGRLRASMRPHHDQIERDVDLMRPTLSLDDYRHFLARSYGFISACEGVIDRADAPDALQVQRRLKSAMLRLDLGALGMSSVEIDRLAIATVLPQVTRWPDAIGYFYVIEGSTLGGQVLSRHLRSRLNVHGAMAFLQSYGQDVGPMWKQLLEVLTTALADPGAESRITETTRQTFQLLGDWHAGRCSTTPPLE